VFDPSEVPQFLDESDVGLKLVVGLKLRVLKAATLTGLRYYKGVGETGTHQGIIYDTATGKEVARTSDTDDATCAGGQWVTLPLQQAFRPALNKDYTVAIDGLTTYTLTEGYALFNTPRGGLLPLGGYYGFKAGRMPITGPGTDNYWIDGGWQAVVAGSVCGVLTGVTCVRRREGPWFCFSREAPWLCHPA
jgi:hypothetical protein